MLHVNFTPDALDVLKKLPSKHARQVAEKISQLAQELNSFPVKELKGSDGFFCLRSGEYRIIYRVQGQDLQVWLIGRRNDDDVYRRFERKR